MTRKLFFLITLSAGCLVVYGQSNDNNLRINQDSANHFFKKGIAEKQVGRSKESLRHFEKAAQFDAGNPAILQELAAAYYNLRKYPQAKETYRKLDETGNSVAETYRQLIQLSFNLKQPDDVLLYAGKLKKMHPGEKVSFYVGKVYYDRENYGEAIRHFSQTMNEEPANAEAPYLIARCYADMQNYKLSIPYFQKAIELDPAKNNWIYELALIHYAIHDDKTSLKLMLEAGEKGFKRDNDYLENLGIAYLNVGELEKGVGIMDEILKNRPSDMNVLNMVAEAYYYKGKYQAAIEYWDRMLSFDKTNASALYMIGMCYQKNGDKEKGRHLCDKAIEMDPSLAHLKQKKQMPGGL